MRIRRAWSRFLRWGTETEGSTRSAALIRVGLVLLIWARWGGEMLVYEHLSPRGVLFSVAFFVSTTLMLVGFASRWSTAATAVVTLTMYFYSGQYLGREPWTHHHTYLLAFSTLLCSLTPCGRSYSVDRWRAVRRARRRGRTPPPERGNLWGLRLIALQMSLVYLWSAYDKSCWGFLSGDRLEHYFMRYYVGSNHPHWAGTDVVTMLMAVLVVALEYALAVGLLFGRTRRWLLLPGLALHGLFYVLLPVRTYSLTVALLYLAYVDADSVHDVIEEVQGVT